MSDQSHYVRRLKRYVRKPDGWYWQRWGLRGQVAYGPYRSRFRARLSFWFGP